MFEKESVDIKELKIKYEDLINLKNEINKKYERLKEESNNKIYVEDNSYELDSYSECLIYTSDIEAAKSLFKDILFINYKDINSNIDELIERITKLDIQEIYIQGNNIKPQELARIKRRSKQKSLEYKTFLFSNELDLIEKILEFRKKNNNYFYI
ncbi:hypothetical protein [Faecalimicrobium dakarense]|uniref:hypothetical protein n=1 Tax=Faecalimicrobium dakarense TaxID=1301100 RepID=UPI0004AD2725|nr:hypothetical protein [[Clostridium] dakarense]